MKAVGLLCFGHMKQMYKGTPETTAWMQMKRQKSCNSLSGLKFHFTGVNRIFLHLQEDYFICDCVLDFSCLECKVTYIGVISLGSIILYTG